MSEPQPWITLSGKSGILYREHLTRKFARRADRCFSIRYTLAGGQRKHEMLGWASEGWTADMASALLAEFKQNIKLGRHPQTLDEKRTLAAEAKEKQRQTAALDALRDVTFRTIASSYSAWASLHRRDGRALAHILSHHILPVLGDKAAAAITPTDIDALRQILEQTVPLSGRNKNTPDAALSPQTVLHCLKAVREVFNFARETPHPDIDGVMMFSGKNPVCISQRGRGIRLRQLDNRRLRILTKEEIDALLSYTCKNDRFSQCIHDMLLLALDTGVRAGELVRLRREDVDAESGAIRVIAGSDSGETKSGRTRVVHAGHLFPGCRAMLHHRLRECGEYLFSGRDSAMRTAASLSHTMQRICAKLGLNDGVTDPRNTVVWHSLRHTYATLMLEAGVDIYTLKELLGHSSVSVTERYLHLCDRAKREMAMARIAMGKTTVPAH